MKFILFSLAIIAGVSGWSNEVSATKRHTLVLFRQHNEGKTTCQIADGYLKERLSQYAQTFKVAPELISGSAKLERCNLRSGCYMKCVGRIYLPQYLKFATVDLAKHNGKDKIEKCKEDMEKARTEPGVIWAEIDDAAMIRDRSCHVSTEVITQR